MEKKGFTLIELLVVIAIIGILASIVLVSLSGARNKAYDAEIKSELSQIRAGLEVQYSDSGTYVGYTVPTVLVPPACSDDAAYTVQIDAADGQDYAAWADICSKTGTEVWCVDSQGLAMEAAAAPAAGDYTCD